MKKKALLAGSLVAVVIMLLFYFSSNTSSPLPQSDQSAFVSRTPVDGNSSNSSLPENQRFSERRHTRIQQSFEDEDLKSLSEAILRGLQSTNDAEHANVFTNLLLTLISRDPTLAAHLAESLAPENGREEALRRVAQLWGGVDPEAALAWAERLSNADERNSALSDATLRFAQTDPAKAIDLATQHQLNPTNGIMENIASLWAEKDLKSSLAWVARQPPGDQKNQIVARIAFVEAQTSPLDAANRVVRDIPSGPAQEEAVMSVLNRWAHQDFASAAAWVDQFPNGTFRDRAVAELKGIVAYTSQSGTPQ